jgi:hypothetical protein
MIGMVMIWVRRIPDPGVIDGVPAQCRKSQIVPDICFNAVRPMPRDSSRRSDPPGGGLLIAMIPPQNGEHESEQGNLMLRALASGASDRICGRFPELIDLF